MSSKETPAYTLRKSVLTIDEGQSIAEAVELMNAKQVSCLLLVNGARIVGVLTERDVLRRLTLLDVKDKLTRPVGTIATREVLFADADNLHESIVRLHFEKGLRHFPVLRGTDHVIENVAGILTMTDLVRAFLADDAKRRGESAPQEETHARPIGVICHSPVHLERYRGIFGPSGFAPYRIEDPDAFFREHARGGVPLVFDFDGFGKSELARLIPAVKKYPGHLIMTASEPAFVRLFQPYMDHARQTVALKPLDAAYLVWLLETKWSAQKANHSLSSTA